MTLFELASYSSFKNLLARKEKERKRLYSSSYNLCFIIIIIAINYIILTNYNISD